jgi:hypothetical protein
MAGKYPGFSEQLKAMMISASRGELSLTGSDKEDAGARRLAQSVIDFLKGRMMLTQVVATDVVTWKKLSDSYGEFDVQAGYWARNARNFTKSVTGRVSAFMAPAGDDRYELRIQDWASEWSTSYLFNVIESNGDYRFEDAIKPAPSKQPTYDDWDEAPA